MKIFYGEKDIQYYNPDRYAFLNWRFDDSMGTNNMDNPLQPISDNFEMGKAYIANSILTLFSILNNENPLNVADSFIFPILFNAWHGIELWLKSSIHAIYLINGNTNKLKNNHNIYNYIEILKMELINMNMNRTVEFALTEVGTLVEEFKRVNAHFDFARYSFDTSGRYQFYNAPSGDDKQWQKDLHYDGAQIVPNTCVDIHALWEMLLGVVENFRDLVEYLVLLLTVGGELTDKAYESHLQICKSFENKLYDKIPIEPDPLKRIMNIINLHIL